MYINVNIYGHRVRIAIRTSLQLVSGLLDRGLCVIIKRLQRAHNVTWTLLIIRYLYTHYTGYILQFIKLNKVNKNHIKNSGMAHKF